VQAHPIEQVLEYLADGQQSEALEQLDRLIREEPYHGTTHALRALIHANQGRLDRAANDAATAKQLASDHPFVLYAAGAVALQQGAVLEAIRAAQAAQQLNPATPTPCCWRPAPGQPPASGPESSPSPTGLWNRSRRMRKPRCWRLSLGTWNERVSSMKWPGNLSPSDSR
jgi:tetratricopeptide (TPR) repeat protein